ALDQARHSALGEDPVHDAVVLVRIPRPVDARSTRRGVALELLEVVGEARERVSLDPGSLLAQLLPLGQGRGGAVALLPHPPYGLVVPGTARLVDEEQGGALGVRAHGR